MPVPLAGAVERGRPFRDTPMLPGKHSLLSALAAVVAVAGFRSRPYLGRVLQNLHRYSAPGARIYDAISAPVLGPFFAAVAHDLTVVSPHASVLEVGSGPGRLATAIARLAPEARVVGLDVAPDMVDRARARVASLGLANRVELHVGDVAALPFRDASFDVVVSTFSLHHWERPVEGLAEIRRVLRPSGLARIYDVADWIRRVERGGAGIAGLAAAAQFGARGGCTITRVVRLGPIPLVYRADLRRERPVAALG